MTHPLTRPNVGPALIALGGALLLTRVFDFSGLELPFLSAVLVGIGAVRRESAWFIPGGILAGIGLGLGEYLSDASPLAAYLGDDMQTGLGDDAQTGVFLLSFALGWVGVFALSKWLGDVPNTWALIPALVMSVIGALLLSAGVGERIFEAASYLWPLGLVVLGAYLVLRAERS